MKTVYIGSVKNDVNLLPFLISLAVKESVKTSQLFINEACNEFFSNLPFLISSDPKAADIHIIPHNFFSVEKDVRYVEGYREMARKYKKPLYIFNFGDKSDPIYIPEARIFKTSLYKSQRMPNEEAIPPVVEDLLKNKELYIKPKSGKPTVGFVGWAKPPTIKTSIKMAGENFIYDLLSLHQPSLRARKKGLYFRQQALKFLQHSEEVNTDFIIRTNYSMHPATITLDKDTARREFISNIKASDYVLCPKGDGNYSMRFYETLSLGRIPILIDTDIVLPLEDTVRYDDFTLKVKMEHIPFIDSEVARHFHEMNRADYIDIQHKARKHFAQFLRLDKFVQSIFQ